MRRILLILIFILGIGSSAFATSWYYVGTQHESGYSIYVDNDTVIKNNEYAVVWTKTLYTNGSYFMERIYVSHDRYMKIMSAFLYNTQGHLIKRYDFSKYQVQEIVPESDGDFLYHLIW